VLSMCRQIAGSTGDVSENLVGTKGRWQSNGHRFSGAERRRIRIEHEVNPYVQEHIDLLESISSRKPVNELKQVAESTLTAIMGRMSAYTGKAVSWEQALNSKLDTFPKTLAWGPMEEPPIPKPGVTELI
jgi:myo-inositol 2-dehydrogenase / D-chiro-inositol 1-dehydrogenase